MPAPQLTVTALEDEPAKGEGEKAKEKEKKTKSKVKELKKKKQEEKMMDDMERQLLRESKKMDEEKKNIQIDNQLSTFLTSLLTLESGTFPRLQCAMMRARARVRVIARGVACKL
jgi:ribosomal protein S4